MEIYKFLSYLVVMAGVTYAIRAVPFVLCRGEIKNRFVQSFLDYIPYAVLGAMTFPAIFYSTGDWLSGIAACIVAFGLSLYERSLLTVAVFTCLAALIVKVLINI